MIRKNETQLKYLYGEEVVNILKECIKAEIKSGNCVTINVNSIDEVTDRHVEKASKKLKKKG